MKDNSKIAFLIIGVMAVCLTIFTIKSVMIPFNDVDEYVIIAKYIAGMTNIKVFTLHSALYPFLAAPFISVFRNLLSFQLLTVGISILIVISIWLASRDLKALLLWSFSALTWHAIGAIGSIIPAALTLLLAYCFFEKWESSEKLRWMALSGLSLGLSSAFYEGSWPVSVIFILVFFYRKKFSSLIFFLLLAILGYSARLGVDYIIFGSALSSTIRMGFANFYVLLGYHPENHVNVTLYRVVEALFIISPLLVFSYRLLKDKKEEFFFILVSFIIIGLITPSVRYLYLIMPVTLLILSRIVSRKEIIAHILLSIPFIFILTATQFSTELWDHSDLNLDVHELENDYSGMMITDRNVDLVVASKAWKGNIYFIWLDDYLASKEGNAMLKKYEYTESVKGHLYKKLFFIMGQKRVSNDSYPDNLPLIVKKQLKPSLEGYVKDKCYRVICVYRKSS